MEIFNSSYIQAICYVAKKLIRYGAIIIASLSAGQAFSVEIPGLYNTGVDDFGVELSPGAQDAHYKLVHPVFTEILLNGISTGIVSSSLRILTGFDISSGFISGINTLEFVVTNTPQATGNPTGLLVTDMVGEVEGCIPY